MRYEEIVKARLQVEAAQRRRETAATKIQKAWQEYKVRHVKRNLWHSSSLLNLKRCVLQPFVQAKKKAAEPKKIKGKGKGGKKKK